MLFLRDATLTLRRIFSKLRRPPNSYLFAWRVTYFWSLHSSLLVTSNYIGTSTASRPSMNVRCLIPRNCPRQFRLNYKCHVHRKRISARGKNPGIYLHQPATKIARTNQQRNWLKYDSSQCEYDQVMPRTLIIEQPVARRGRNTEHYQ